jgi:hypothetical protein
MTRFGWKSGFIYVYGSSGRIVSFNGTTPTAGDQNGINGGEALDMGITFPHGEPEPTTTQAPGFLNDFDGLSFANRDIQFTTTLSAFDLDQIAALQGQNVVQRGGAYVTGMSPKNQQYPSVALLLHSEAKSRDRATRGQRKVAGLIVMSADMVPYGPDNLEGVVAQQNRFKIVPSARIRMPWGETFYESVWGDCEYNYALFNHNYQTDIDVWYGDGAETQFFMEREVPDPFDNSNDALAMYINSTAQDIVTDYTVDAATNSVTFGVAPASGACIQFWHSIIGTC